MSFVLTSIAIIRAACRDFATTQGFSPSFWVALVFCHVPHESSFLNKDFQSSNYLLSNKLNFLSHPCAFLYNHVVSWFCTIMNIHTSVSLLVSFFFFVVLRLTLRCQDNKAFIVFLTSSASPIMSHIAFFKLLSFPCPHDF